MKNIYPTLVSSARLVSGVLHSPAFMWIKSFHKIPSFSVFSSEPFLLRLYLIFERLLFRIFSSLSCVSLACFSCLCLRIEFLICVLFSTLSPIMLAFRLRHVVPFGPVGLLCARPSPPDETLRLWINLTGALSDRILPSIPFLFFFSNSSLASRLFPLMCTFMDENSVSLGL